MAIVTLAQARAHLRVESDYPADQIQVYIDGATEAASRYLNRTIFENTGARDAAWTALPAELKAAQDAYDAAVAAADAVEDETQKQAMLDVAAVTLAEAKDAANWKLLGIVSTPSVVTAVLLTLGHLFANREDVVVGATAIELPLGARSLLRPYRRVMMP